MPIPIVVSVTGDTKGLQKELGAAGNEATAFGRKFDLGAAAKVGAFAGVATLAVGALLELGAAAADDAREAAALELAISNAGAATGDWRAEIDQAIASGEQLAFTDSQIREAMTTLVGATGSVTEATDSLGLAQDLARLKGIDLAAAADAVAKAEGGSATALAKLLKISTEGKDATEILAEAQQLAAGQAELYGDSQAGAADRAGIKLAELGEKVGTLVLPILELLTEILGTAIDVMSEVADVVVPILQDAMTELAPAFDVAGDAIGTVVDWIRTLFGWLGDAIRRVRDLIDALADLNPFTEDFAKNRGTLGDLQGPGLAGLVGGPATDARQISITIPNADPESIVRALVRWAGPNGGSPALLRILDR